MPVGKGEHFTLRNIYIDYPLEEAMYRWDHRAKKVFVRFYGKAESAGAVPHDNRLFNDALDPKKTLLNAPELKGLSWTGHH